MARDCFRINNEFVRIFFLETIRFSAHFQREYQKRVSLLAVNISSIIRKKRNSRSRNREREERGKEVEEQEGNSIR